MADNQVSKISWDTNFSSLEREPYSTVVFPLCNCFQLKGIWRRCNDLGTTGTKMHNGSGVGLRKHVLFMQPSLSQQGVLGTKGSNFKIPLLNVHELLKIRGSAIHIEFYISLLKKKKSHYH